MVTNSHLLSQQPYFKLDGHATENVDSVEILGVHFDSKMRQESHVSSRIQKCRRAFYALKDVGLGYPGCNAKVKAYLWNTSCAPILQYGLDCVNLHQAQIKQVKTCQGNLVKQSLYRFA